MTETAEAVRYLNEGHARGKIVITIAEETSQREEHFVAPHRRNHENPSPPTP